MVLYEDNNSLIRLSEFLKTIDTKKYKRILVERLDSIEGNYR